VVSVRIISFHWLSTIAKQSLNTTSHLIFFRIHRHIVQSDSLHNFLLHSLNTGVIRQLKIEETSVRLGQHQVLTRVILRHDLLNHESDVLLLKRLIISWDSFLSPTEFDELLLIALFQRAEELPEHLYGGVVLVVHASVLRVSLD